MRKYSANTTIQYRRTLESRVPSLTLSDVIGDGEFVYHIWQDSDPARIRIGRRRPSLTKKTAHEALQTLRGLMGVVVINKPCLTFTRGKIQTLVVAFNTVKPWSYKSILTVRVRLANTKTIFKRKRQETEKATPTRDHPLTQYKSHRRCSLRIGSVHLSITQHRFYAPTVNICVCSTRL